MAVTYNYYRCGRKFSINLENIIPIIEISNNIRDAIAESILELGNRLRLGTFNEMLYDEAMMFIGDKYGVDHWDLYVNRDIDDSIEELKRCVADHNRKHIMLRYYKQLELEDTISIAKSYINYILSCIKNEVGVDVVKIEKIVSNFCNLSPCLAPGDLYMLVSDTGLEQYLYEVVA